MKKVFLALMCVGALLMTACEPANKDDIKGEGEWITSSSQIDVKLLDPQNKQCWYIDMWCDGTTIGREYQWATEAEIGLAVKLMLEMDLKVNGKQTKKFMYNHSDANDKDACEAQVWEGCECWEETISYNGSQSETNYGWLPEANMRERHDYYESNGLTHTYKHADATDQEACEALNDEEPPVVPLDEPRCWKVTFTIGGQSTTLYTWGYEASIQSEVNATITAGGTASYELADAADEDSCTALNQ